MTLPGGYALAPGSEWTDLAATWPLRFVTRETEPGHWLTDVVPVTPTGPLTQAHLVCHHCNQSVWCLAPDLSVPGSYVFEDAEIRAGILSHIRRSHGDVVAS